ncbi:MAG: FAD-binding protein, partial [Gammaproteobacteria bacterium]
MLRILTELKRILPQASCITEPEAMHVYECDALTAYRRLPRAVVLPDSIEQLRAVLKLCHEAKVAIVARGAGTGLSGGALPHSEGVLLSLAKFTRILRLDSLNRTATVEPGVRNIAISEAAAPYGLHYAPDPSSQIACTIGGNVAENSGGVHCLKYGLTVHNLLALKALSIAAEELCIGSQALDAPGYDLLALLTGSEGLLAIITEVTVRLLPIPQYARVALAAFDSVQQAGAAVAA